MKRVAYGIAASIFASGIFMVGLAAGRSLQKTADDTQFEDHLHAEVMRFYGSGGEQVILNEPDLDRARVAWEIGLGRGIALPTLRRGWCNSMWAIACANLRDFSITVNRYADLGGVDLFTIYLHEIGHLLHVRHIPGDPVMDSRYFLPATGVSPAAVAAARKFFIDYEE